MLRPTIVLTAAVLPLLAAGAASALDNEIDFDAVCECVCAVPNHGRIVNYDSGGFRCSFYDGKTCNVEDDQGNVRTGTLQLCTKVEETASGPGGRLPSVTTDNPVLTIDPGPAYDFNQQLRQHMQVLPDFGTATPTR